MTRRPWSKSSLSNLLDGCSWQYALEKVHGLPTAPTPQLVIGTVHHAAIERHERERLVWFRTQGQHGSADGISLDQATTVALEALYPELEDVPDLQWELHDMDYADAEQHLVAALNNWYTTPIEDGQLGAGGTLRERLLGMRPVAVEPYFKVPHGEGELHGYIDWLGYDHDTSSWVVVDEKTASNFGRWDTEGSGHESEAGTYTVGSEVASSLPPSGPIRMEWHIARKRQSDHARFQGVRVASMEVSDLQKGWLADRVQQANRIVEKSDFLPDPTWNLCSEKWCPFFRGCQVTGELQPDALPLAAISQDG